MFKFFRKFSKSPTFPESLRPQLRTIERIRRRITRLLGRIRVSENTFMVTIAVSIGLLSGLCNYAFRKLIDGVHWLVVTQGGELLGIAHVAPSTGRLLAIFFPMFGGLLMIPLWIWFGNDLKFGFSRFLAQVNLRGGKVPARTILTRGFASAITIGSGGSAGQEGPIAQIGGAIGSQTGQLLGMSGDRLKTLVACGVSGGWLRPSMRRSPGSFSPRRSSCSHPSRCRALPQSSSPAA